MFTIEIEDERLVFTNFSIVSLILFLRCKRYQEMFLIQGLVLEHFSVDSEWRETTFSVIQLFILSFIHSSFHLSFHYLIPFIDPFNNQFFEPFNDLFR